MIPLDCTHQALATPPRHQGDNRSNILVMRKFVVLLALALALRLAAQQPDGTPLRARVEDGAATRASSS